jgi:hypothetical protein
MANPNAKFGAISKVAHSKGTHYFEIENNISVYLILIMIQIVSQYADETDNVNEKLSLCGSRKCFRISFFLPKI